MNRLKCILSSCIFLFSIAHAQAPELPTLPPLRIGVEQFSPPFMIMGANRTFSGFDVDMMGYLCPAINRTCEFVPLPWPEVLPLIAQGELDLAVGIIAITADRLKTINFTIPYMTIELRLLTRTDNVKEPFSYELLKNKTIGMEDATILRQLIKTVPIENPKMVTYRSIEEEILALSEGKIDYVIMDNFSAVYWQNNSGVLTTVGKPIPTKYFMGIAVDPRQPELVEALNNALKQYFADGGYKKNYDRYILEFQKVPAFKQ